MNINNIPLILPAYPVKKVTRVVREDKQKQTGGRQSQQQQKKNNEDFSNENPVHHIDEIV